jgi:hypothetical protein
LSNAQSIGDGQNNGDELFDDPNNGDNPFNESELVKWKPHVSNKSFQRRSSLVKTDSTSAPSHRVRAANPLIKLVDDPNFRGVGGAISTKARLLHQSGPTDSPPVAWGSSSKSFSGRIPKGLQTRKSSLLVFQKGSLQTLKGKYTPPTANAGQCRGVTSFERQGGIFWDENGTDATATITSGVTNDEERPMPTGQELLRLAGLNDDADALSDFEEDVAIASHVSPTAQESDVVLLSLCITSMLTLYL